MILVLFFVVIFGGQASAQEWSPYYPHPNNRVPPASSWWGDRADDFMDCGNWSDCERLRRRGRDERRQPRRCYDFDDRAGRMVEVPCDY